MDENRYVLESNKYSKRRLTFGEASIFIQRHVEEALAAGKVVTHLRIAEDYEDMSSFEASITITLFQGAQVNE